METVINNSFWGQNKHYSEVKDEIARLTFGTRILYKFKYIIININF